VESIGLAAYPDLCNPECGNCACAAEYEECALGGSMDAECADCYLTWHTSPSDLRDKTRLKRGERHLGGSNLGFADGHAAWWNAERLLDKWADEARGKGSMEAMGLEAQGPMSWCETGSGPFGVVNPDEPTLR
jgi:prepilin-type processing-associated H-X9-DG protein